MSAVTYDHVERDAHDVLLAEGTPAESVLDTGHRGRFENAAAPLTLHPGLMQTRRDIEGCAKLVTQGPALAAIRARIARHCCQDALRLTQPPQARFFDLFGTVPIGFAG